MIELTIQEAFENVCRILASGEAIYVEGQPGCGKSTVMRMASQYGQKIGRFTAGEKIFATTEVSSLDIFGLWEVKDGRTRRCPADVIDFDNACLIGIDELPDCETLEQSGFYRLALDRMVGDRKLHPDSVVIAAGNRPEDNAAANPISTALDDRFVTLRIRADYETTLNWGYRRNWPATVLGYLRAFGKEAIDNGWQPDTPHNCSTPRGFERLAKLEPCFAGMKTKLIEANAVGCIGESNGLRFAAFRGLDIPDPKLALSQPDRAPVDVEAQFVYNAAIVGSVADSKQLNNALRYALRLDSIHGVGLFADLRIAKGVDTVSKCAAYIDCATQFSDLI